MSQSEKQTLDPSFQASARAELARLAQELKELDSRYPLSKSSVREFLLR